MNIEGLLRAALEASDEGIVATNAEWRVVLWNRGAARMFGWTAAEALGRPVYELHMRGVDPQELERCGTELRDGKGVRLSGLRVRKDGSTLHVESQITPMIDAAGSYVGALGTVRDITPLVESERALRLSEEKFAKAFHSSPYFTMISRLRDGRIVEANEGFEKLLGIPVAEAVGRMTVADLNMWADPKDRGRFVAQLSAQGGVRDFPSVFVSRDGEQRDVEITAQTIDLAGEPHIIGTARDVTDLKRSQETLRQSEEKFAKAFHASPDWMAISRQADGRFIDVNEGFERLTGYTRDEAVGHTSLELGVWTDAQSRAAFLSRLRERGMVTDFHYDLRRKDGGLRQCLLSSVAIEVGGEACMISIVRDVTEQRRAEAERAKSEEKFTKAFHANPDAIVIARRGDGVVLEANAGFEWLTGYSADEAAGRSTVEALGIWADPQRRREYVAILKAQGRVSGFAHDIRRKDGELRQCMASSVAIELGGEPCVITIVRDVTEQRRAEAERAKSEEKFATVFHASPDGIMIARAEDGLILDLNESFQRMFGYSREEAVGRTVLELGFWAFPERRARFVAEVRARGMVSGYEFVMRTKAGALRDMTTSTVLIDIGGVPCLISVSRDVTDRLRAEEEIRNLNVTLEQRVRDRTAELEEAVREMESFSYSISHDLRAPLRAIAGYAKIVEEDYAAAIDAEGKRLLDRIAGGAIRMGELIDDLLDFSRIGRADLKKSLVDMGGMVRDALGEISEVAAGRHRIDIGELPQAVADRGLLRQVWVNLLSNAVKYSRQRDLARIEVGGIEEGDALHYWVRDNGAGFDMAYADKLFKVFQRLHRDPAFEGTGVGLAIVARIVHKHGGRVWAEGAPGAGATFHFTLPSRGD
jgi:PAS domain S-box-containing protein